MTSNSFKWPKIAKKTSKRLQIDLKLETLDFSLLWIANVRSFGTLNIWANFADFYPLWSNCGHSDTAHMTGARNHASHIWLEAWVAQGPKPRAAYMQWDISRWRWWGIEVTTRETIISALLLTPFFKHWPGASLETDDDDNSHKIHNHWQLLCAFQLFYFLFSNVGHITFKENLILRIWTILNSSNGEIDKN